jgi:hypothetical protein
VLLVRLLGDAMRKLVNDEFLKRMVSANAEHAMNGTTSKGFTKWVNKDIQKAASTGDWSELIEKAQKSTKYFRNSFYA